MTKIEVKKSDRVGCFLDGTTFIGFGYRLGCFPTPKSIGTDLRIREGTLNPKIVLDSGEVVWGCECWWGNAKEIQFKIDALGSLKRDITVKQLRKDFYGHLPEADRPKLEIIEFTVVEDETNDN